MSYKITTQRNANTKKRRIIIELEPEFGCESPTVTIQGGTMVPKNQADIHFIVTDLQKILKGYKPVEKSGSKA